jgi:hypothetical protein
LGSKTMNASQKFNSVFQDEIPNSVLSQTKSSTIKLPTLQSRVSHPRSPWTTALRAKFDELTSLPRGWDGYTAGPVSFTCAQFAANLIERLYTKDVPAPQLVPGSDGTLQIEWHRKQFDVEIDVLGAYEVIATRRNLATDQVEELELEADFTALTEWIAALRTAQVFTLRVEA